MSGPIVVCGARGFVGRHLVDRLVASGRSVRCGTRDPERARARFPNRDWVALDVEDVPSLVSAFEGADAVVYLVHQMRAKSADLVTLERESAARVLRAAERAGVRRIVYLGGPAPAGDVMSSHLKARLATGEALRGGAVSTIELRAPMIVGAGSESWWIVRDLALRLPVMVLPSWLGTRSQPIALCDVLRALERAIDLDQEGSAWFDLPGPEVLSAKQILIRVAAARGMRPVMVPIPMLSPSLSSHWIRWVTRADYGVARKLVDGLTNDLLSDGEGFWAIAPDLPRTPFDRAVRTALDDEDTDAVPVGMRLLEGAVRRLGRRAA